MPAKPHSGLAMILSLQATRLPRSRLSWRPFAFRTLRCAQSVTLRFRRHGRPTPLPSALPSPTLVSCLLRAQDWTVESCSTMRGTLHTPLLRTTSTASTTGRLPRT